MQFVIDERQIEIDESEPDSSAPRLRNGAVLVEVLRRSNRDCRDCNVLRRVWVCA